MKRTIPTKTKTNKQPSLETTVIYWLKEEEQVCWSGDEQVIDRPRELKFECV